MTNTLPEWAYSVDKWVFNLTEKFDTYAQEQWLSTQAIQSLKTELNKFYGPWKNLVALEWYMKNTIERKVAQAREQLQRSSKILQGVYIAPEQSVQIAQAPETHNPESKWDTYLKKLIKDTTAGKNFMNAYDPMRWQNI